MRILDIQFSPNPNAVKITVDASLTPPGTILSESRTTHTLSKEIQSLDGVEDAFVQGQWISVIFQSKQERGNRQELEAIAERIRNYDLSSSATKGINDNDCQGLDEDPQLMLIKDVIEDEVMPYLNSHGGSIELLGLEDNTVLIRYVGACGGCPASTSGTLQAIEKILQFEVDPDLKVKTV